MPIDVLSFFIQSENHIHKTRRKSLSIFHYLMRNHSPKSDKMSLKNNNFSSTKNHIHLYPSQKS